MESSESASSASALECRENCVFCQSNGESGAAASQLKILKCLHVSCKSCAEQFLRYDNTIRCARCQIVTPDPGPGRKLTAYLPNWPTPRSTAHDDNHDDGDESEPCDLQPSDHDRSTQLCQDSDCAGFDEPANTRCLTCDLSLCRQHAVLHVRSRKRANHSMADVPASKRKMELSGDIDPCPLHNQHLRSYCKSCNVLMCDRCHTSKQHTAHSSHDVLEVSVAAKELREFQERHHLREIPNLQNVVAAVEARIKAINAEVEAKSAEIAADVAMAVKIIEERGKEKRCELDQARWNVLKKLEGIRNNTQEELRKRNNLLFLTKHVSDTAALHVLPHHDCATSLSLKSSDKPDTAVEEQSQGTSHVPQHVDPDNYKLVFQFAPMANDARVLTWFSKWRENRTSDASLRTFISSVGHTFDVNAKSKGIILSRQSSKATLAAGFPRGDYDWHTVCSIPPPVTFRVQVSEGDSYIGFVSQETPVAKNDMWPHGNQFPGWVSSQEDVLQTAGNALGVPWLEDDVISLTLDTVAHTATALHERTGAADTISIDKSLFPVYFRAELGNASIRLLPLFI
ncbi:tripartite motif-containing protein 16-like [Sycon ciliatum]|uniref:tripartite motif-containing protein 16-like n=1 Tax=Sycon ciliatum TaxID=27933 RepID=UPI0031F64B48